TSRMCLRPIADSPALKNPGVNLARGSFTSAPVMPAGSGPAGSGANGLSCSFLVSCDGEADGVCAIVWIPKHEHKIMTANSKWCTRFIVSPLRFFAQHRLHNSDFGALTAVDIGHEIKELSILARARSVE